MARIVIVEDEVLINKHITDELTYIGHKCLSAFDGEEALDLINCSILICLSRFFLKTTERKRNIIRLNR